ncbi:MAG: STAS domain-containing protein [SAR324 cluster bacterium]|nr:STAS domain-containing protein [SAR324 cluster bacterium]
MKTSYHMEDAVCIANVEGSFMNVQAQQFKSKLQALLEDPASEALLINLEKTVRIDSIALGVITIISKKAKQEQLGFAVCQPNELVASIFRVTKLHQVFSVFKTKEEALTHLKNKET